MIKEDFKRKCNLCNETILVKDFNDHAEQIHSGYFASFSANNVRLLKKEYFCPINDQWYGSRVYLARYLHKNEISNEQYYLEFGEKYMPKEWLENTTDPVLGDARNHNKCFECEKIVPFDEGHWCYNAFCSFPCSTSWYAKNTNRIERAMKTNEQRKKDDPTHQLQPTQLDYWIVKKGMTKAEAKEKVKERQTTNTLEAFIKRADGDVEKGKELWMQRQERWLNTLEERGWFGNHSEVSKKLFEEIQRRLTFIELLFGDKERKIAIGDRWAKPDCSVVGSKQIIEFYGDYWHANPTKYESDDVVKRLDEGSYITAKEIWERDRTRLELLKAHGFNVEIVWEDEFTKNPELVIEKCIKHLTNSLPRQLQQEFFCSLVNQ